MKQTLKYFYLFLSLSLMFTGIVFPQSGWVRQYPPTQAQNISLLSVSFADSNTGFIVGGFGTILSTTNGGTEWISQSSGTRNWLRGVSTADVNTVTTVGDSGIILHTTNGGKVWARQPSGTTCTLRAVSFTDANTGMVVGDSGTILRTINGGTTWISQSGGTLYNLNSLSFIDANNGTVVGDSGTILRTTNGGTTWTNQSIQSNYRKWQLYGVCFTNADTGTAVGYFSPNGIVISPGGDPGGIIIHTVDGGITWIVISNGLYNVWAMEPLVGVSFADANNGTVVGYDVIFHTRSGVGKTSINYIDGVGYWLRQSIDNNNLFGVCFTDANKGTVVGANGTILHTNTGGVTSVKNNSTELSNQFALEQNYPNPFNPTTTISYQLPVRSFVILKIYDILGREVTTLVNQNQKAGNYSVNFNASELSSGLYFYQLTADNYVVTRKMMLIK